MTVPPTKEGQTAAACPRPERGKAGLTRREDQDPLQLSRWEICLFLDREEAHGGRSQIGKPHRRKRKTGFPETKCVGVGVGWGEGPPCLGKKMHRRRKQNTAVRSCDQPEAHRP